MIVVLLAHELTEDLRPRIDARKGPSHVDGRGLREATAEWNPGPYLGPMDRRLLEKGFDTGSAHVRLSFATLATAQELRAASALVKEIVSAAGVGVVLERANGLVLDADSFAHRMGNPDDETCDPVLAWLDWGLDSDADGRVYFRTAGMEALGRRDVELAVRDPRDGSELSYAGRSVLFACFAGADGARLRVPVDADFSSRGVLTRGERFYEFAIEDRGRRRALIPIASATPERERAEA